MYLHTPTGLESSTVYRTDTASGSSTPTVVYRRDGGVDPIETRVGSSGSNVRSGDPNGGRVVFWSSAQTLYLKALDYRGNVLGGAPVITSTGATPPAPPAGSPGGGGAASATGTATLAAGSVVVSNTSVTAGTVVRLAYKTVGGTPGAVYVSARSAGASFTITSTSGADTSTVVWEVLSW